MKTILLFTESSDKRKVILTHDKDVQISRETRNEIDYIVLRFPTEKVIFDEFKLRGNDVLGVGFAARTNGNETEVSFFDRVTFTWNLTNLEDIGLLRVTQRHIPDNEDFYAYYINAKGVNQWGYNALFMTLQWLREQYKKKQQRKKEQI